MEVWVVKTKDTGFIDEDIKIFSNYHLANHYIERKGKEKEWIPKGFNIIDNTYFLNKEKVFAVRITYNQYNRSGYQWSVDIRKKFNDSFIEIAYFKKVIDARHFIEKTYDYQYIVRD